jgi:hypothetical protein
LGGKYETGREKGWKFKRKNLLKKEERKRKKGGNKKRKW